MSYIGTPGTPGMVHKERKIKFDKKHKVIKNGTK
jgi:hypothetical protein